MPKRWLCCRITVVGRPIENVIKLSDEGTGSAVGGKALEDPLKFIEELRHSGQVEGWVGNIPEREVGSWFNEGEREFLGDDLVRLDVTLPKTVIDGIVRRPVETAAGEDVTATGPAKVLRHRYGAIGTNVETKPHQRTLGSAAPRMGKRASSARGTGG
jgi:hypothetical protein